MRRTGVRAGFALLLGAVPLGAQSAPGLDGAWRVVEVEVTGPGARTVEAPQPGLLVFVGGYYS